MLDGGAPINKDYAHTALAYLNYRYFKDYDKSAEHIRACKNGLNLDSMDFLGCDDLRLESLVLPMQGTNLNLARSAQAMEGRGELDWAIGQWENILAGFEYEKDELGIRCVREEIQRLQWKKEYEKGDWVELGFDEEMNGWWIHGGIWERVDERTVRAKQKGTKVDTLLIATLEPGDSFEYEADVWFDGEPVKYTTMGIFFHRGQRNTDQYDMMRNVSARLGYRKEGSVGWGYGRINYNTPIEMTEDLRFHLRVIVNGDQMTGYVNGVEVGKGEVPNSREGKEPHTRRIAIGAWTPGHAGQAEFINVRIRQHTPPASLDF